MGVHSGSDEGGDPPCWAHLSESWPSNSESGPEQPGFSAFESLVVEMGDAVVVCDPSGKITFWNRAATRLFGATPPPGSSLDVIIPVKHRERHWEGYQRVMASGSTRYHERTLEVPAVHHDGHLISIAFTIALLRSRTDGPVTGVAAVIRDNEDNFRRRRIVERLQEHGSGD